VVSVNSGLKNRARTVDQVVMYVIMLKAVLYVNGVSYGIEQS